MNLEGNNNWEKFASKLWPNFTHIEQQTFEKEGKMAKVLKEWGMQGGTTEKMIQIFKELDRNDVLIELKKYFPNIEK